MHSSPEFAVNSDRRTLRPVLGMQLELDHQEISDFPRRLTRSIHRPIHVTGDTIVLDDMRSERPEFNFPRNGIYYITNGSIYHLPTATKE